MRNMPFQKRRWIALAAAVLIEMQLGIAYAWSVFLEPLTAKYGWTVSGITTAYTMMYIFVMLFTMFFGQRLRKALALKKEVLIGGIIYAAALLGMSMMRSSVIELCFWWGIVYSVGTSMSYPVLISYAIELFPDKPGLAGGIVTAGYSLGSVIWAPLTAHIVETTGDISTAFRILGIAFLIGIPVMTVFLMNVSEIPAMKPIAQGTKQAALPSSIYDMGKSEMIRTGAFYAGMAALILGLACGGMTVSQASPIMTLRFGVSATQAAFVVSLLSVMNMAGRILWGSVSDRIGKLKTLAVLHVIAGVSMAGLLLIHQQTLFTVMLMGTLLAYGGVTCLVAPVTGELFGQAHVAENYTVTFCAFGLSSFFGPSLVSAIRQSTGDYTLAFAVAVVFSVIGAVLSLRLYGMLQQKRKERI